MSEQVQQSMPERAKSVMTPNYRPAPVVFSRGEGAHLYAEDGRRFLDFTAGIAVCCLGHGHAGLARAISEQARDLLHVSNLYLNRPSIELAERLTSVCFADNVYFANSGAEANEAAMKLARRYQQLIKGENRFKIVATTKSFMDEPGPPSAPRGSLSITRALRPWSKALCMCPMTTSRPWKRWSMAIPARYWWSRFRARAVSLRRLQVIYRDSGTCVIAMERY